VSGELKQHAIQVQSSTQGPLTLPVTDDQFDVDTLCDMGSICDTF